MDKSKMVLRISIVLCLSLLFVSCDVESSVSISSEKESSSELDSSESSSAPISSSPEEPIARRLKVGEYFTDIEYGDLDFQNEFQITDKEALELVIATIQEDEKDSSKEHNSFSCINMVSIDNLVYFVIREYSVNHENPKQTSAVAHFYVDAETGSVFLLGNMNKEDDGRDILIKLK